VVGAIREAREEGGGGGGWSLLGVPAGPCTASIHCCEKNARRWRMSHDLDATGTHRGVVRSCNRTMHASHTHAASAGVFRLRWLVQCCAAVAAGRCTLTETLLRVPRGYLAKRLTEAPCQCSPQCQQRPHVHTIRCAEATRWPFWQPRCHPTSSASCASASPATPSPPAGVCAHLMCSYQMASLLSRFWQRGTCAAGAARAACPRCPSSARAAAARPV